MPKPIRHIKRKTARMIVKHRKRYRGRLTAAQDKLRRKRMSFFILALAVALLIFPGFMFLRYKLTTQSVDTAEIRQNQALYSVAAIVYRHTQAYATYCRKKGYIMRHYRQTFLAENKDVLMSLDATVRKNEQTSDRVIRQIHQGFSSVVQKSISREFARLRNRGMTGENGQVLTSDTDICQYIDENTSVWLKTEKQKDIESLNNLAKTVIVE